MRKIFKLFVVVAIISMFSSCAVHRLMKSGDIDTQYATALRYYKNKKYSKAFTLFDNVIANIAGTTKEDTLLFYMGQCAYNMKNYALAAETFDTYRKRFARSEFLEEAEYLYALCYYFDSKPVEKDQTETTQAIVAMNEYLNRYPESSHVPEIHQMIDELQNKLYEKMYVNASLYYKLGSYNAAITSLKDVIKEHPEIPQKEEMMYLICKSWYQYAVNSIFARQLDRYMKTIDAYFNYLTFYPESDKYRKELDRMYERAKTFTDKYGYKAQKAEMNANSISSRKKNIEECKEKLFSVETKEERIALKQTIKSEKAAIKEQKKALREEEKDYRLERKITKAENKATKKLEKEEQKGREAEKKAYERSMKKINKKAGKNDDDSILEEKID